MRCMVLYVATTNPGKVRDFAWAAEGRLPGGGSIEVAPLPGLKEVPAPAEDGETFEANARLKAEYYSRRAPGLWVVADDSGLNVDALGGRPGVRSARFAEDLLAEELGFERDHAPAQPTIDGTTDERNNTTLLRLMADIPPEKRNARYKCVLALARDGEVALMAEGALEGRILFAGRGAGGFGYDPLFWLPEVEMTMAEIDPPTRIRFSHRGRALRALLGKIDEFASA